MSEELANWQSMALAPYDGTEIIGKYGDEEAIVFWTYDRT